MTQRMTQANYSPLYVGIDLGTTNSVLAIVNERPDGSIVSMVADTERVTDAYSIAGGRARFTRMRRPLLPSCVYYRQEEGFRPIVGDFAKSQYALRPHLVAKSIKSQMGKPLAEGLQQEVPDRTPAQISARILKHLLESASRINRCEINDAVITVPANFDSAMCAATLEAARIAGIKVTAPDGSARPILLSEPNAVIYDLVNRIKNGNIPNTVIDLDTKKRALVFDFGGGTLDITMHELSRREGMDDVLKVDEIATNRYTLLGGDDFDEAIARAMYRRYLNQYSRSAEVVSRLRRDEDAILAILNGMAEELKLQVSESHAKDYASSGWDDWDEGEAGFAVGGNIAGTGYAYDDTFTAEDVENILRPFMAEDLTYQDYKRMDQISDTRNIIYPILDVLKKTSDKTGEADVHVDAVIVNGGMSKFYMVIDRLKSFFGFDPIVAMDPDLSVARGAAVYHYYLRHNESMQDDMRKVELPDNPSELPVRRVNRTASKAVGMELGRTILNDSLYLGLKNGAVQEIIPTGAELPHSSETMTGFSIASGQRILQIPIKSRNLDGTYRTIAKGNITLRQGYAEGAYLQFKVDMSTNKVLTMRAWIYSDIECTNQQEEGVCAISIDNNEEPQPEPQPIGTRLNPENELKNILQLATQFESAQRRGLAGHRQASDMAKKIRERMDRIKIASNKEDFAEPIIKGIRDARSMEAKSRYIVIARRIGKGWSPDQKRRLAEQCMYLIKPTIDFGLGTENKNLVINIIYTLSMCGSKEQVSQLAALHGNHRYRQACLFTHAHTRTCAEWVRDEFIRDARRAQVISSNAMQVTSHAIGVLLKKGTGNENVFDIREEERIVDVFCEAIMSAMLTKDTLIPAIIALGCVADQRYDYAVSGECAERALNCIRTLHRCYAVNIVEMLVKSRSIAEKMITGVNLTQEEEQFLIAKLESEEN